MKETENVNGGNGEKKKKDEPPKVCGSCKYWQMIIQNPQNSMAMGACVNNGDDEEGNGIAPFGFVTVPGADPCPCGGAGWELRPKQTIIQAPKGLANNSRLHISR